MTPKGAGETPLRVPLESEEDKAKRAAYQKRTMDLDAQLQAERKAQLAANAQRLLPQTAAYVEAAWSYEHRPATLSAQSVEAFAQAQGLEGWALRQWRDHLGLGDYPLMLQTTTDVAGHKGLFQWRGAADCPNLLVNTADVPRTITTLTVPPRSVAVHPGPTNGVVVAWRSPISGTVAITGKVVDADPNCGNGIAWAVDLRGIGGVQELASGEFPNGGKQDFVAGKHAEGLKLVTVKEGDRLDFCVLPNGEYSCDTTVIDATIQEVNRSDGKPGRSWNLTHDLLNDPLQSGKGNPHSDSYGNAAVWHFEDMADRQRGGGGSPAGNPQLAAWYTAVNQKGVARETVHSASEAYAKSFNLVDEKSPFWIRTPQDESALPTNAKDRIAALSAQLEVLRKNPPPPVRFANGVQEGGVPESPHAGVHDVKVHIRGNYARLGDLVPRHFPVVLAGENQPPITQGSGRLQLAEWLTSPTHPLTARVWVNRVWQNHFGQGIVHTPSNFGKMGEAPTHPELLDWLAWNFEHTGDGGTEMGWSTKQLHRLILLSATYQQSSEPLPAALKADPDNRWFGRMNRQRLEAEQVRDNMLAVAGRLDTTMGGVAFRDFSTPRRTLYLMIVRSDRSGFGPLFDGADSTACVDRRTVSTVAPQSLYLLNNPFVLEQTRAVAARIVKEIPDGAANDTARIRRAYQLLYGRAPSVEEIAIGTRFLIKARSQSTTSTVGVTATAPKSMEQTTGMTAWERYCQILLCANESMYVD